MLFVLLEMNYHSFLSSTDTPQNDVVHVTQLERDTILVCLDRKSIKIHVAIVYCLFMQSVENQLFFFFFLRFYKNCESSRKVKIQSQVVFRANIWLSDWVYRYDGPILFNIDIGYMLSCSVMKVFLITRTNTLSHYLQKKMTVPKTGTCQWIATPGLVSTSHFHFLACSIFY